MIQFGGAMALSIIVAACGKTEGTGPEDRPASEAGPAASKAGEAFSATGEVTAIAGDQVTISHGPVEGIGWPAMTMAFRAESPDMVQGVNVGDQVSFAFRQDGGTYVLTSLKAG